MANRREHSFVDDIEGTICSHCHQWKPLTSFTKDNSRWDKISLICKDCQKEKRNTPEQKAKQKAYKDKWDAEHPDYMKEWHNNHTEHDKEYRVEHKDEIRVRMQAYNAANKEHRNEVKKLWRHNNPEKAKAEVLNRIAKKHEAEGIITGEIIKEVSEFWDYKCAYCGADLSDGSGHIDHIVPLSKGGSNLIENLCLACQHCNCSKGAKDVEVWCQEQGFSNPFATFLT